AIKESHMDPFRNHLLLSVYYVYLLLPLFLWHLDLKKTSFAIFVFLCLSFRNPNRVVVVNPSGDLYSRADGRVLEISLRNGKRIVSVFLSILDIHVQCAPVNGVVIAQRYKSGEF